jgi:hypothetical protein
MKEVQYLFNKPQKQLVKHPRNTTFLVIGWTSPQHFPITKHQQTSPKITRKIILASKKQPTWKRQ